MAGSSILVSSTAACTFTCSTDRASDTDPDRNGPQLPSPALFTNTAIFTHHTHTITITITYTIISYHIHAVETHLVDQVAVPQLLHQGEDALCLG